MSARKRGLWSKRIAAGIYVMWGTSHYGLPHLHRGASPTGGPWAIVTVAHRIIGVGRLPEGVR